MSNTGGDDDDRPMNGGPAVPSDKSEPVGAEPPPAVAPPKPGKAGLWIGVALGALLMLCANTAFQQYRERDGGGGGGPPEPTDSRRAPRESADAAARAAAANADTSTDPDAADRAYIEARERGWNSGVTAAPADRKGPSFSLPVLFAKLTGNDGKTCVRIWSPDDFSVGDAFAEKLTAAEPKWDVSTTETTAQCDGDYFVTLWGTETETSNTEYGGWLFGNTRTTYLGYVTVAAWNAPGLGKEPSLVIQSDSEQDEVLDDVVKTFADYVRKSGAGRQGKHALKPTKDGQTCVKVSDLDKPGMKSVAEDLQWADGEIWVLNYLSDKHNDRSCPPDTYVTYASSASRNARDGNVGYTHAYAFNHPSSYFPLTATAFARGEDRSSNMALESALKLLRKSRDAEN